MKVSDTTMVRKMFLIAVILLLLVGMLNAVGTAYARYITVVSGESDANVTAKPRAYVAGGDEWVSESLPSGVDVRKKEFTVRNYLISTVEETVFETVEDTVVETVVEKVVETVEERNVSATVRIYAPGALKFL